jgi:hypothetical protein
MLPPCQAFKFFFSVIQNKVKTARSIDITVFTFYSVWQTEDKYILIWIQIYKYHQARIAAVWTFLFHAILSFYLTPLYIKFKAERRWTIEAMNPLVNSNETSPSTGTIK